MDRIDAIVIGAGVVGLAVARALARAGREVLILERHGLIGSETSARNSEVIHAAAGEELIEGGGFAHPGRVNCVGRGVQLGSSR